jgi:hypothetical protein
MTVKATKVIYNLSDTPIPRGAIGKVTGHCDDGQAYLQWDGYGGGHTFHVPDDYLRAVECRACKHEIDDEDDEADEAGLCALCHEVNYLAHEYGYDEILRVLPLLRELGTRESEQAA